VTWAAIAGRLLFCIVAKVQKKESKWRIAGAIVAGYLTIGALAIVTAWIVGFAMPEVNTSGLVPSYYFAIVAATDAVYSVAGGYVCAKIALTAHRPATIGLIILGELISAFSVVQSWYVAPRWYLFSLLLLFPLLAWAGCWLRVKQHPVKPQMVKVHA